MSYLERVMNSRRTNREFALVFVGATVGDLIGSDTPNWWASLILGIGVCAIGFLVVDMLWPNGRAT